ncbi:MAG: hypothetical protein OEZ25_06520, partial [Candidatus Bathyarchaeota archaeon]|nr:hypothetical protein [Candidatus Bathyarchaeota archaeon]
KSIILLILLALLLTNAPSFSKPVAAAEYDMTWRSWVDVNGNGQTDPLEFQGDFSIHYSAPDSAEPSSPISIDLTVAYLDNEFAIAHKHTFKNMVMSLRETPGGTDIVSDTSSYSTITLNKGESVSDTFNLITPSESGVYYVVFTFRHELTGGGIVKGTYYIVVDTGKWSPELCPTIENKLSSQLSLSLDKPSINCSESVTFSGSLSPGKSTYITIEFSTDGGSMWQTLATITTQLNGFYSLEWTPADAGVYLLRARWPGDDMYASATSSTRELTILKVTTQISCELSSETITHIFSHGTVAIFGEITPAVSDANVHIYYRTDDGEWLVLTSVKTDPNGEYSYSWLPPSVGKYDVKAIWSGDAYHEGAESPTASVTIVDYTLLTIIAVVAVIGVASFYFLKIRKRPVHPPSTLPALTCPHCGASMTPDADYCPSCGKKPKQSLQ